MQKKSLFKRPKVMLVLSLMLCMSILFSSNVFAVDGEVSSRQPQVFAGTTTTANETVEHQVTVDFAGRDSMAFCFMRDGNGGMKANVYDSTGVLIVTKVYGKTIEGGQAPGVTWHIMPKPLDGSDIQTYRVEIVATNDIPINYRVTVGDVADLETLISGKENSFLINEYVNELSNGNMCSNYFRSDYIPNKTETYYKFVATGRKTTITLTSKYPQLRFKVRDIDSKLLFDSHIDGTHRTKYLGSFSDGEKVKLDTTAGELIEIIVYTPPELQTTADPFTGYYNLSVGQPQMMFDSAEAYSISTITTSKTNFSPNATISFIDVPQTAQVTQMRLKAKDGKLYTSDVNQWRTRKSTSYAWNDSAGLSPYMQIPYELLSPYNSFLAGDWHFSLKAESNGIKFRPGLHASYQYELGD